MIAPIIFPFTFTLSILSPVLAGLFFFNGINTKKETRSNILLTTLFGGVIGVLCLLGYSSRIVAESRYYIFGGEVVKKSVFVEGDGETVDHYENVYSFRSFRRINHDKLALLDYMILVVIIGGCAFTFYCWSKDSITSKNVKNVELGNGYENFFIITQLVLATGLIICFLNMPSGYYQFIRWIVMIGAFYLSGRYHKKENLFGWAFFVLIALLFNPIEVIYFSKIVWNVIDIGLIVILFTISVKQYIDEKY